MISASLYNHRIAPRKVRLIADMIRGKSAIQAQGMLLHAVKKAKHPILTLLNSAIANAKNNFDIEKDVLYVQEIRVDQGYVLRRNMPVSRGRAHPIKKRTSHISIILAPIAEKVKKSAKSDAVKVVAGAKPAKKTKASGSANKTK